MLSAHWKYLKYVLKHKLLVFNAGVELGVPTHQLVLHDFQKFLPAEWGPYVRRFYSEETPAYSEFQHAWLHHLRLGGKHHYQYWLLPQQDGTQQALEMPERYVLEMLADWTAMGRNFGEEDAPRGWWEKKKNEMILHPKTRKRIEELLK